MATSNRRDDILRKVRGLLAKADSTPFAPEAESFREAADRLMTVYAIEEHEARYQNTDSALARQPVRADFDFEWYRGQASSQMWHLFMEVVTHCRCVAAFGRSFYDDQRNRKLPVYGARDDLDYLNLLFTSLLLQMSARIKPTYDPNESLAVNITRAKEAGMAWRDIAHWAGRPDVIISTGVQASWVTMYRKQCKIEGRTPIRQNNPKIYARDFAWGFTNTVIDRLREMRRVQGQNTGSMAIALRDIRELSREAMWADFEDMRPHAPDCECDVCHFMRCSDPACQRTRCVEARKPVRVRKLREYATDYKAMARGGEAGREARIENRGDKLGNQREIR